MYKSIIKFDFNFIDDWLVHESLLVDMQVYFFLKIVHK